MSKIEKQEEVVAALYIERELYGKVAEAKMNEWNTLRNKEKKAFDAWLVEAKTLLNMKEGENDE